MAVRIPASGSWIDIDTSSTARNFCRDQDNVSYRMIPSAQLVETLGHGVNHLLGRMPRVYFNQVQTNASAPRPHADTLSYYWRYPDRADNEFTWTIRTVVSPPICTAISNGVLYPYYNLQNSTWINASMAANAVAVNCWYDVECLELAINRGAAATDADGYAGLYIGGGLVVLDTAVQAEPLPAFNTNVHTCVNTGVALRQGPILAGPMEDIRSKFHEARKTLLPTVFCWGGTNVASNTTAATSAESIVAANVTTYTNPFDGSTTREVNSVGAMAPAYLAGVGPATLRSGSRLKATFRVTGVCTNTRSDLNYSYSNVMFIGPEHVAPNNCVISLNSDGLSVFGDDSKFIYLNPQADDSWLNVDANKIDMLVATDLDVNVHIVSVQGWMLYDANL